MKSFLVRFCVVSVSYWYKITPEWSVKDPQSFSIHNLKIMEFYTFTEEMYLISKHLFLIILKWLLFTVFQFVLWQFYTLLCVLYLGGIDTDTINHNLLQKNLKHVYCLKDIVDMVFWIKKPFIFVVGASMLFSKVLESSALHQL